ncbi:MAG: Asp-tRNA(Asn)/Glu-tRNA(Gln) amidotransferase subunit GatB [Clostridia bacterium]|nr:Asp-tRNA(Asn)/Glu-tRNA(Gln) amidotransferase subunit GatB [Clostridia bacterium]
MKPMEYEAVIGLEVHAELKTATKIFCSCSTQFGAPPNTQCCPICMGYPGALPRWNRRAVELAVRAGLALQCTVAPYSRMDRKHYFYPDLPKAFQISQEMHPLCREGKVTFSVGEQTHTVGIERIHVEEDAGKLLHTDQKTLVDYNRSGVPLIEIVSKPMIHSGEEAAAYLRALRAVLVRCDVSDCKMQEGSMRCDVNISLRPRGSASFGTRVEIKNLNSFSFTEKAIRYEIQRQTALLERGEKINTETRRFDEATGTTVLMRVKESAEDYHFLPEPNLPAIRIRQRDIDAIRATLPELPREHAARLREGYALSAEEAAFLVLEPAVADYFEDVAGKTRFPKLAYHLLVGELLPKCGDPFSSPVAAHRLAELTDLLGDGILNRATAKKLLLRLLNADFSPAEIVERESLGQISSEELLRPIVLQVLQGNPRAVQDYRNGKKAALQALQGRVMAATAGRADPILSERLLLEALAGGGVLNV